MTSSFSSPDLVLLDRHLAGTVTADEQVALETRLQTDPELQQILDCLRSESNLSSRAVGNLDEAWRRDASKIFGSAPTSHTITPATRRQAPHKRTLLRWGGYSVLGVALLVATTPMMRTVQQRIVSSATAPTVKEYRTQAGQRARITLPDNSTVLLGPKSSLRYSAEFGQSSNRTVTLDGQALFTVTHAAGEPFIVRAGNVATRVLGTSFAVRRYAADTGAKVVVAEGRVSVGQTILATGDVALATNPQHISVSRGHAMNDLLAWTQGRLVFFNMPLRDVIPELERWYGMPVEVTDPVLLDRLVVATLDGEVAAEAIELIAYGVKGHARITAQRAIISLP